VRIRGSILKRIVVKEDIIKGILSYDRDNKYPQKISDIMADSGRATLCLNIYGRFLQGKGFVNESLNNVIINRKRHTLWSLYREVIKNYAKFKGFAIHINYNAAYEIVELQNIPFEYTRLTTPDDTEYVGKIAVYDDWAREKSLRTISRIMRNDIKAIHIFNPLPEVIQAQVEIAEGWDKYRGQIFWYSEEGSSKYPLCSLDSVLEDCVTDGQIKTFKYNNVTTNFLASHLLVTRKIEGAKDTDQEPAEFEKMIVQFQGAENANKIMHVEADYDEDIPELKKFEHVNDDKLFQYTEESIHQNIRKELLIPPVLVGDLIAGKLGTSEEIYDAYALYNALTFKERDELSKLFSNFLELWHKDLGDDFTIEPVTIDLGEREKMAKKVDNLIEEEQVKVNKLRAINDARKLFMRKRQQVIKGIKEDEVEWKKVYEEGGAHWAEDLQPSQFAQEFAEKLVSENKKSVLEIGCGNGKDSILFAIAGLDVTGIDIVPEAIELAQENAKKAGVKVEFQEGDVESLSFPDSTFDAVFTLSVLHSTDIEKSLSEIDRVLNPKGLAFIYIYSDVQKIDKEETVFITVDEFIKLLKDFTITDIYTNQEEEYDEVGEKHLIIVAEVQKK